MANETLNTILENQNAYIRAGEAARSALDGKVTQALNQLDNDDAALTIIKNGVNLALSDFNRLANREYGYTHEAIVTDGLENDYNLIINGGYQRLYNLPMDWSTEYASYYYLDGSNYVLNNSATWDWNKEYYKRYTPNSDLANVSAVGMLAVLNHGVYTAVPTQPADWAENYDKYFYASGNGYLLNTDSEWNPNRSYYSYSGDAVRTQGNRLFINGEESDGYTFRGVNAENGIEFVKIWYFQNGNNQLSLTEQSFELYITDIKANSVIDISPSYFEAQTLKTNAVDLISTGTVTKNIVFNSSSYSIQIPTSARSVTSYMTTIPNYNPSSPFLNKTALKKVVLPVLTEIKGLTNNRSGFSGCTNLEEIIFPNLVNITTGSIGEATYPVFYGVKNIVIPKSVKTLGNYLFRNNLNITLNCNEATSISSSWCVIAPTESFNMAAGWECTINIAVAASNWIPERFTTIPAQKNENDTYYLYNLLKTFTYTPDAHIITIPQAYVSDDLIDAYMGIGWDLLGA